MIGDVNLFIGEEEAEVEIMIAEERGRGKGIGEEAVSLIISYAINVSLSKISYSKSLQFPESLPSQILRENHWRQHSKSITFREEARIPAKKSFCCVQGVHSGASRQ